MKKIMMKAIILHNMIVKCRGDDYKSQIFNFSMNAVSQSMFLGEAGNS